MITLAAALALMITATAPRTVEAQGIPVRLSTRSMGMGGATLLSGGPIETGYINPGALSLTGGFHLYIPMVQLGFNQTLIDMIDFVDENQDNFSNFSTLPLASQITFAREVNETFNNQWVNLAVDPLVGIQMGKLSLAAYSVTRANVQIYGDPDPITPNAGIKMWPVVDLVLNAGLGLQLGPMLHGGVGLRYLQRSFTSTIIDINSEDFENIGDVFSEAMDESEESVSGFAVDVGATFTLTKALAVGGVIRSLVGSIGDANAPVEWENKPIIGAGVRLKPLELLMGIPTFILKDLTLEADLMDITNSNDEDFTEKLLLGAEAKIYPIIPIPIYLRAGYGRGKMNLGAGLHFLILDIGAAMTTVRTQTPTGEFLDDDIFSLSVGIGW